MIKGVPGGIVVDGKPTVLTEVYEGWKYDTIAVHNSGSAVATGQQFYFFRDLTNKDNIDTNITQQRRISRGEEMDIVTVGCHVSNRTPAGATVVPLNFTWAIERLFLLVRINKKDVTEGPLMFFQPGIGAYGNSNESNTSIISNGVPSLASTRRLLKTITINSDHDIEGIVTHYAASWLTGYASPAAGAGVAANAAILVKLLFGGKVKSGVTRG